MPDTLLDFDCAGVQVDVPPFQPEHFGNPRAGRNADLYDQTMGLFHASEHARRLVKREDLTFVSMVLLAQLRLAGWAAPALFPQTMALCIVEDPAHDGTYAV